MGNGCDPLRLHCYPLGPFQQQRLYARLECLNLKVSVTLLSSSTWRYKVSALVTSVADPLFQTISSGYLCSRPTVPDKVYHPQRFHISHSYLDWWNTRLFEADSSIQMNVISLLWNWFICRVSLHQHFLHLQDAKTWGLNMAATLPAFQMKYNLWCSDWMKLFSVLVIGSPNPLLSWTANCI